MKGPASMTQPSGRPHASCAGAHSCAKASSQRRMATRGAFLAQKSTFGNPQEKQPTEVTNQRVRRVCERITLSLQGNRPRDTPKKTLSTCSARLLPIGLTVRFRALTVLEPCTLLALSGRSLERLVQPVLRATVHVETGQAAPPASAARCAHRPEGLAGGGRGGHSFNRAVARDRRGGLPPLRQDAAP